MEYSAPGIMQTSRRLLLLAFLAFMSLGLPDTVLGVAWPSLRQVFELPASALGLVLGAGMVGYFLSGLAAGTLLSALGVGKLLALSGAVVAAALAAYAAAPSWSLFFPAGVFMGLGSGAIDAGLNAHATRHFSARHINWLHAFWGVGASLGPLIMTGAIAEGFGYRAGYALLALVLAGMAAAFAFTRREWDAGARPSAAALAGRAPAAESALDILGHRAVWLHIAAFFFYTGLEATAGQWCFTLLRQAHGLEVEAAGAWTAAYWGSITLGRVLLGYWVDDWGADRLLRASSLGMLAGAAALSVSSGALGRVGLLVLGLSLAPVFPTLMARTPARLGGAARHAVGFQVSAATLGAALMPGVGGVILERVGLFAVPIWALGLGLTFFAVHEAVLVVTRRAAVAGESAPR